MTETYKDLAKVMIMNHEGFSSKAYKCSAGKITVWYGRNLEDKGISEAEAEQLLMNDLRECEIALRGHFSGLWLNLNDVRKAILLDMCYNLGLWGLKGFRKMFTALYAGNYEAASIEMLDSKWAKQTGQRAIQLSRMMRTGK